MARTRRTAAVQQPENPAEGNDNEPLARQRVYGPNTTEWLNNERSQDPVFASAQTLESFVAFIGPVQPWECCRDHLFPPAARHIGLQRYVPTAEEVAQSQLPPGKTRSWSTCSRDIYCARRLEGESAFKRINCHNRDHFPAFVYL